MQHSSKNITSVGSANIFLVKLLYINILIKFIIIQKKKDLNEHCIDNIRIELIADFLDENPENKIAETLLRH